MKIRLCIVTMTPELVYEAANTALQHASGAVELWIGANCCDIDKSRLFPCERVEIVRFDDNQGVVPAMHALWERMPRVVDSSDDILCYIHDDCLLLEENWDGRVVSIFSTQPAADGIGLIGGTGIGADDIYQSPYQAYQLGRHNVHSAIVDAEAHGARAEGPMKIATADGCALFVRRSFLDQVGGWSWWPEVNHGYDNGLACMLRRHGRDLWLLPVVFQHPSQLKFRLTEDQKNHLAIDQFHTRFGTDLEVHTRAHRLLYDMFRDVLPFHVR